MAASHVALSVPPQPEFARSVRMMAANLAVLCSMTVEEVEDVRMAAEEAFVYACATLPPVCDVSFDIYADELSMSFGLGPRDAEHDFAVAEQVGLAKVLLSAVSDSFEVTPDKSSLLVSKMVGAAHGV